MNNKNWIYVLDSDGYGKVKLEHAPDGWESKQISIKRSPTYFGLFREFSVSLKFVKDGMDYVQRAYEVEGTEFEIYIGIYEYNASLDKYLLFYSGIIDLSTYAFEETFVECDINDSDEARKFMSRDDVPVNLLATESIEGESLSLIPATSIQLHQRELFYTATFAVDETSKEMTSDDTGTIGGLEGFVLPMKIVQNEIDNVQDPANLNLDNVDSRFWNPAAFPATVIVQGSIFGGVINTDTTTNTWRISFRVYTDDTMTAVDYEVPVWTYTGQLESEPIIDFDINLQLNNIPDDAPMALVMREIATGGGEFTVVWTQIDLTFKSLINYDGSRAQGHLLFEAGSKISDVILDRSGAFVSGLLGKTSNGYPSDGDAAYYSLHSGKQIRGIPNESVTTTLQDFFQSLNSIFNVGLGIEYDVVNRPYLRLEEKSYFFSGTVSVTIHSVRDIRKEVAREWIYNEVEVGYDKIEYEEINGLEEQNNKFNWSTVISTIKNKLDLVSKYRADGYGIEFARRSQYVDEATTDTKYDNETFIVNVINENGTYRSAKDEDFDFVENIISPDTAYNLKISPGRMLRNHGNVIRAGLEKYLSDTIKFQFAEQKADMKSQETGKSAITENENIPTDEINTGIWIPELYIFESRLTRSQLATITRNPNQLIKFSTTTEGNTIKYYYGWIISIEGNPETGLATWTLLRANASSPDLTIVDPEGSPEVDPPDIVEPSVDYGVFVGRFEFVFVG